MAKVQISLFEKFDQHPKRYIALCIAFYLFVNNSINATSVWMEHNRDDVPPAISIWEPFVWEYTSAISALMILPLLFYWFGRLPLRLEQAGRQVFLHILATLAFALAHVTLMVMLRKLVYVLQGGHYQFGPLLTEFFYEYRKDAWGYLFWLLMYHIYHFIYSRLKGEATLVDTQPPQPATQVPEHLLVRKLDKEFLVKVDEIEWLESAGNYVNLHSNGRIYPLRATLTSLIPRLEAKGFSRIHRSFGVNHSMVESIDTQPSGDAEIKLRSGQLLTLSRRYKDAFKEKLL